MNSNKSRSSTKQGFNKWHYSLTDHEQG